MKNTHNIFLMAALMFALVASPVRAKEGEAHVAAITDINHTRWVNGLTIRGVLEFELGLSEDFAGGKKSDGVLATVELGIDAAINDHISASVTFLFEEDNTALEVDEAAINVSLSEDVSISMGQMYLPFGSYETNMLSDPLTLEIGEIRESAIAVNFEIDGVYGSVFINNGEMTKQTAEEKMDQFGFGIGYGAERDGRLSYDIGFSYINNLGDSDRVADVLQANIGGPTPTIMSQYVGAYIFYTNITFGEVNLIAEYLSATDRFLAAEINFNGTGAQPGALNLEVALNTELAGMPASWAVGYQSSDEAIDLKLPKSKLLAALSLEVMKNTALSFEITKNEDYGTADAGTAPIAGSGNSATTFTAQFAVGF